jgi:hypothetical protein
MNSRVDIVGWNWTERTEAPDWKGRSIRRRVPSIGESAVEDLEVDGEARDGGDEDGRL